MANHKLQLLSFSYKDFYIASSVTLVFVISGINMLLSLRLTFKYARLLLFFKLYCTLANKN